MRLAAVRWGIGALAALALTGAVLACNFSGDPSVELSWPEVADCMRGDDPDRKRPAGKTASAVYYRGAADGCMARHADTAPPPLPADCYGTERKAARRYFGLSEARLAESYAAAVCAHYFIQEQTAR